MEIVRSLAQKLNITEQEVSSFLASAPLKYKVYKIPKRTSGFRIIAQPSKKLKEYQRTFIELFPLACHQAAYAYREGISIKDNALIHKKSKYLLKIDLENFFNSITNELFWDIWQKNSVLPDLNEKVLLERLLFWSPDKKISSRLILSVGAPSSPSLSNFFMYDFDESLSRYCLEKKIRYTRYADDLTFSTCEKGVLFEIPDLVSHILRQLFGDKLSINRRKTIFSSKAHNRHVTGVTLTNEESLSIGRQRKRYIKHLVHQYLLNKLDQDDVSHLKGLLAFAKHIEPDFLDRLKAKYSDKTISQILGERNG